MALAIHREDMEERTLPQTPMIQTPLEVKVVSEAQVRVQLEDPQADLGEIQMIRMVPPQEGLQVDMEQAKRTTTPPGPLAILLQEDMDQPTPMTIPPEPQETLLQEDMEATTTTIHTAQATLATATANLVTALPASSWRRLAASSRTRACNKKDRPSVLLLEMMITLLMETLAVETMAAEIMTTTIIRWSTSEDDCTM